jgi:hypothetical protein
MLGTEKMRAFGFKEKINAWLKCDLAVTFIFTITF